MLFLAIISFGQEVKATEEKVTFSTGEHNAIVVNIPNGTSEGVKTALKNEMKNWGGSFDEKSGEYKAIGATMKAMGEKPFDGYAKILEVGDVIKVAFAVDLGGAYMTSQQHSEQFKVIQDKAKKFAAKAGVASVNGVLKVENKKLKALEKEQKGIEKEIEKSKSAIENAKKKIADEEKKIADAEAKVKTKKEEVAKQAEIVKALEKKN